jgi:hypothetical protein
MSALRWYSGTITVSQAMSCLVLLPMDRFIHYYNYGYLNKAYQTGMVENIIMLSGQVRP